MKAFLSPVPLNVGPSVESRRHDSPLGAVPIHSCSVTFPKQDVLLKKNYTKKVTFQNVTVHTIVVVDSFDTTFTEIPCGNSACGMQIFVFAASVSPPAKVKPTSVVSIVVYSYRSATSWTTHESRNCLRGSTVKNGARLLIWNATKSSMSSSC